MLGNLLCWFGIHDMDVEDWNKFEGWLKCQRCGHREPMRGRVLVEWIRYRGRREQ